MADSKKNLRAILGDCRRSLRPELAAELSVAIQRGVLGSEFYRDSRRVVLYAAKDHEVATELILGDALASGREVFFPRLDSARSKIVASRVWDVSDLRPGSFGILEPAADAEAAAPGSLAKALILVPGLAFTLDGDRLGRGGGHYDRFLAEVWPEAITVGLSYSFQLLDRVPHMELDRQLKFIVTEFAQYRACDAPLPAREALTQEVHPGDLDSSNPGIHRRWRGLSGLGKSAAAQGRR